MNALQSKPVKYAVTILGILLFLFFAYTDHTFRAGMQYVLYAFMGLVGLCLAFFWYEGLMEVKLRRFGKKLTATIIKVYEVHEEHDPDEECCGPDTSLVLEAEWHDPLAGETQTFKKHVWLSDRNRVEGKKQITVYVNKRDKTKYLVDLKSAK